MTEFEKCASCGADVPTDQIYCSECGIRQKPSEDLPLYRPSNNTDQSSQKEYNNGIGYTLLIIGVLVMIAGLTVGLLLAKPEYRYDDFNWTLALTYWVSSFISGMMFIGFSEVIKLLQSINDKLSRKKD